MRNYLSAFAGLAMIGTGIYLFMSKKLPRGYRNNNPLNIRYSSSNNWLGKVQNNTDGVFEQFTSMIYGYRAALYLIRKYIGQGYTTVAQIISRWAPENENNTTGYIQRVCKITGMEADTVVGTHDREKLVAMVAAMAQVENGNVSGQPVRSQIEDGYKLL